VAILFLDTSAFLKLYVAEKGSNWLKTFASGNQLVISELTFYESATALRRRYLDGIFTRQEASKLYSQIYHDRFNYDIIAIGSDRQLNRVVSLSFNLPPNLRLRALDSLQLTAAIINQMRASNQQPHDIVTFVSSDQQLLKVAQAQGFAIENPEDHP
jgi:predicted nucleic acid-binding protein